MEKGLATVRPNLEALAREVEAKRADYLTALENAAEASTFTFEVPHEGFPHVTMIASDREIKMFKVRLSVEVARLAYELAVQRYNGALEDKRRLRAEVNSWLMFAVTVTITLATCVQAWKMYH